MKTKMTIVLVALMTGTAFAAFQAPLPEFKNEKQLAEWRAEKASEATSQGYAAETTAFYTGRTYLSTSGSYFFQYRSYSPELARWTTEDPSGFPDGANGNSYAPIPVSEIDYCGLSRVKISDVYTLNFEHEYTLGQAMLDVGLLVWKIPFVADAAYAKFRNDINIRYPVGDARVVGQLQHTNWGEIEEPNLLRTNDSIVYNEFEKNAAGTSYIFTAVVYSIRDFIYE